ncbi:MAG TPA: cation diffusion facilitator family transporter [Caldisericia bacterium]|nr:cation diffusion facilitator family transporter [Caldisericia bacterium]HPF48275.1 cation diffusion facilitator family transporter [Caldisericia bacterium]HPI83546.1 cation diffusion facilitator family transporter [Caldisericia bacterium]HPQ92728.1 cation diffusion facilitator family transporter [Caldisericia bacterium]HRV74174.1 cation diffusion facilitator family transporter [Caldisericia bacterium]
MENNCDKCVIEKRAIVSGLVLNVSLCVGKFVGGILGRSSVLIADGIHTATDIATDVAILIGSKHWHKPADDDHRYGHERIETVVTLGIGVVLAFTAIELSIDAVKKLVSGDFITPSFFTLWIALSSVVIKEALYRYTVNVGKKTGSTALIANAWHHRTDALSSIPVVLVILISQLWPSLVWLDSIGVILVSLFILKAAYDISKPAFSDLIDTGVDAKTLKQIETVTQSFENVLETHHIRTRYVGNNVYVDMHVVVKSDMTIDESHTLSHKIHDKLISDIHCVYDAIIHIEPESERINI